MITLTVLLAVVAPSLAQNATAPVHEMTLDNGLHVIVRPVSTAPQTTVMTLYDVGELHDPQGRSGMAHLLEHLLVTCATDESDATTAEQWFAKYGAQANAQTGLDYTVVATSIANDLLEVELKNAAARFSSLKITENDLKREVPRLLAELEHMHNGPPSLSAHNFARSHIDPAPAGGQRGGTAAHVNELTVEDMQQRYDALYRANNATLVVAGDFEMEPTVELVVQHFSDLPSGSELPTARAQATPDLGGKKSRTVSSAHVGEGPHGVVTLAFPAPDVTSKDFAAFLLTVPRLYQQLIGHGVTATPSFRPFIYTPLDDPGAVYISHPIRHHAEADAAIETLWQCVTAATMSDPGAPLDRSAFQYGFAPMLHVMRVPDRIVAMNTYGEALLLGRFHQLGLSSAVLREHVMDLYPDTMNEAAARMFSKDRSFTAIVTAE